jgi:hypothetical protein
MSPGFVVPLRTYDIQSHTYSRPHSQPASTSTLEGRRRMKLCTDTQ